MKTLPTVSAGLITALALGMGTASAADALNYQEREPSFFEEQSASARFAPVTGSDQVASVDIWLLGHPDGDGVLDAVLDGEATAAIRRAAEIPDFVTSYDEYAKNDPDSYSGS